MCHLVDIFRSYQLMLVETHTLSVSECVCVCVKRTFNIVENKLSV